MRTVLLLLLPVLLTAQDITQSGDTLFIRSKVVIIETNDFNVVKCPGCVGNTTPGIAVLLDSCIRNSEWSSTYSAALPDSAAFFEPATMDFFATLGINAFDDCGIDTFFVDNLELTPPGGLEPGPGETKEMRIRLKAIDIDQTPKMREETMLWIRDNSGCL